MYLLNCENKHSKNNLSRTVTDLLKHQFFLHKSKLYFDTYLSNKLINKTM